MNNNGSKVYDGTNVASVTLTGVLAKDAANVAGVASFSQSKVGNGLTVTLNALTGMLLVIMCYPSSCSQRSRHSLLRPISRHGPST